VELAALAEAIPSLKERISSIGDLATEISEQAEIHVKYDGYLEKEKDLAEKMNRLEHVKLPQGFDYHSLSSLSMEARLKLTKIRPETLGQASRISGVNPSDVSILMIHLDRRG
jgi:tRNA uridine 5-carboxymethylaminomethyl modification enzyme